jgi:hypothetical protein
MTHIEMVCANIRPVLYFFSALSPPLTQKRTVRYRHQPPVIVITQSASVDLGLVR